MSVLGMWCVLFIVALVVILFSVLYKKKFTLRELTLIGVMAALSCIMYTFFRIPFAVGGSKSSFHLGNTFTVLTALLLDGVSGGLAGSIGLSLADVLAGDMSYAITTFLLKFIIGISCGFFAVKVFRIREHSRSEGVSYYLRVVGSAFSGLFINVFTDPLMGFFRKTLIEGQPAEIATYLAKITAGVTLVNSLLSCACAVIFFLALEPVLKKIKN